MKTKQEPFVKKRDGQSDLHKKPFTKLKVASVALLAGLMAGPIVFPKMIRAQDTSTQAITTEKKALPPELANLPTVTLEEMRKLDKATKSETDPQFVVGNTDTTPLQAFRIPHFAWEINTEVAFSDGHGSIKVHVVIDTTNYKPGTFTKNGDEIIESMGKTALVLSNDKPVCGIIDLTSLDALYKKATGNELKYVKLVAFSGKDPSMGAYAAVHIVPVNRPDGEIVAGTPILTIGVQAATKEAYTGENLIAMH